MSAVVQHWLDTPIIASIIGAAIVFSSFFCSNVENRWKHENYWYWFQVSWFLAFSHSNNVPTYQTLGYVHTTQCVYSNSNEFYLYNLLHGITINPLKLRCLYAHHFRENQIRATPNTYLIPCIWYKHIQWTGASIWCAIMPQLNANVFIVQRRNESCFRTIKCMNKEILWRHGEEDRRQRWRRWRWHTQESHGRVWCDTSIR